MPPDRATVFCEPYSDKAACLSSVSLAATRARDLVDDFAQLKGWLCPNSSWGVACVAFVLQLCIMSEVTFCSTANVQHVNGHMEENNCFVVWTASPCRNILTDFLTNVCQFSGLRPCWRILAWVCSSVPQNLREMSRAHLLNKRILCYI